VDSVVVLVGARKGQGIGHGRHGRYGLHAVEVIISPGGRHRGRRSVLEHNLADEGAVSKVCVGGAMRSIADGREASGRVVGVSVQRFRIAINAHCRASQIAIVGVGDGNSVGWGLGCRV
jgi:hypothetical protein